MRKRSLSFFIAAATFTFFAFVQSHEAQGIEPRTAPPATMQMQPQSTQPVMAMTPEMEIAALKKKVAKLEDQNKQLTDQNSKQTDQIGKLNTQIAEMTRKGGSLVRAYCESQYISKNTAGVTRDCKTSGYACEQVSGLCYSQCSTSDMCSFGFVCDTAERRCVKPY